jgi:L-lactate dehydrogenase (cytochrome)
MSLSNLHSVADVRRRAKNRLPSPIWHFLDGGAEDEVSLRRNEAAFAEVVLVPRTLTTNAAPDTRARILGASVDLPLICGPTGASRLFHSTGERAVARAAADAGILYALATGSTFTIEEIAAESGGPKIFQLYPFKNHDLMCSLMDRAKAAGYCALCITVDAPVSGKRETAMRAGLSLPIRWSLNNVLRYALRPRWVLDHLTAAPLQMGNLAEFSSRAGLTAQVALFGEQLSAETTWHDAQKIIESWNGPAAIKGILSVDDALRARDAGATAIFVSNHGGRQLDHAIAPVQALPEIAHVLKGQLEIIVDGGVRRGVNILQALALGADACAIGRPYLYGLSAAGEMGVARVLAILREEFIRVMQLTGCTTLQDITSELLGIET